MRETSGGFFLQVSNLTARIEDDFGFQSMFKERLPAANFELGLEIICECLTGVWGEIPRLVAVVA